MNKSYYTLKWENFKALALILLSPTTSHLYRAEFVELCALLEHAIVTHPVQILCYPMWIHWLRVDVLGSPKRGIQ